MRGEGAKGSPLSTVAWDSRASTTRSPSASPGSATPSDVDGDGPNEQALFPTGGIDRAGTSIWLVSCRERCLVSVSSVRRPYE
jgi:hypothetical protein